jgi:hypothetical protein
MKRVQCSCCRSVVRVTEENSLNGEYPDHWVIDESDYTLRCSWECQTY